MQRGAGRKTWQKEIQTQKGYDTVVNWCFTPSQPLLLYQGELL